MTKIDEIALRVFKGCDDCMFCNTDTWVTSFAKALLADPEILVELSKGAVPVAWLDLSKMKPSGMVYATGFQSNNKQSPVFTHPANTEAAIAASCEQGKQDAVPEELRSLINKAQSHMLRNREADQVSIALTQYLIVAAPKEKLDEQQ